MASIFGLVRHVTSSQKPTSPLHLLGSHSHEWGKRDKTRHGAEGVMPRLSCHAVVPDRSSFRRLLAWQLPRQVLVGASCVRSIGDGDGIFCELGTKWRPRFAVPVAVRHTS